MKKITFLCMAAFFCAAFPHRTFAWGKQGHEIVATIAYTLVDTNIKKEVIKYLDGITVAEAGTWMDDVRSDHKYDFMKSWHYVNIEKGQQYVATKEPNLINELNDAIEKLEHKSTLSNEEIKRNLLLVFHLVGDMHQPLHVGYGIDKGGNDIQVKYLTKPANLHRVWDTEIIESEHISANQCLLLTKNFDDDEIKQLKTINVEKWVYEPRALLSGVYSLPEDNTIDQAYIDKNKKIIETQLLIAGIRLSAILEDVFKS